MAGLFNKPNPEEFNRSSNSKAYIWSLLRYTFWLAVVFGVVFIIGLVFLLREDTVHQMIDLRGRNVVEAMTWLQDRSLRVTVSERIDTEVPRFHVIEQNPAPGVSVKENRTISLVVSYGLNNLIMPNYRGTNYVEAYQGLLGMLSGYQVTPQVTKIEKYSDQPAGKVVDHYPASAQPINFEDPFIFIISRGIATNEITVHDYIYQNYLSVEKELLGLGLQVSVDYVTTRERNLAGKIALQSHAKGTVLLPGNSIHFTVGYYDPQSTGTSQVDDTTQNREIIRNYKLVIPTISTQGLFLERVTNQEVYFTPTNQNIETISKTRKIRIEITDQLGTQTLLDEVYPAGASVNFPYRSVGTGKLNVYVDDILFDNITF